MYIDKLNNRFSHYSLSKRNNLSESNKISILSQKASPNTRSKRRRWLVALSCLPLFGIYTAFGLAPTTDIEALKNPTLHTESIAFSTTAFSNDQDNAFVFSDRVKYKDTLSTVLSRLNIKDSEAISFFKHNGLTLTEHNQLKPGQILSATVDDEGHLKALDFQFDKEHAIVINQTDNDQLTAEKVELPIETREVFKSATITHSLFASTDAADIPDKVALQLIKLFESDIDFHRDIRKGDNFKVIYEAGFHNGKQVRSGDILAVEFTNKRKTYTAIGYPDSKGKMHYYTPKGNSLGKTFLRSPLEYTRITSGFSRGRYHPILQRIRAHKGVDMAAPTGTKIRAAGDAVVRFAGWKGGYGRVVMLKHAKGVKTVYGHLSRFAKGLKKGRSVKQGEIIGYVGKSGMATGPHLHYEFLKNGRHMDPMKVALPKSTKIAAAQKAKFLSESKLLLSKLKILEHTNIAALR